MRRGTTVDEYILAEELWQNELLLLRSILLETELEETIKWSAPAYLIKGKNILGLAAFKNYVAIWFLQGVLLKDKKGKLFNAQEGKTKALRQWRLHSIEEIVRDAPLIKAYLEEAIENQKQGKELKPTRSATSLEIPKELEQAFKNDPPLNNSFDTLTLGKKREFAEYVSSAKREATKQNRIDKIIPLIEQGIGLNDKYRKG